MVLMVTLVARFIPAPLAPSAVHAATSCNPYFDQSALEIVQGCALGANFHSAIEQPVIDNLLKLHDLPSSDAGRLLSWQRNIVRATVFSQLLSIIKTPASSRTADEQAAVDHLASLVQGQRVQAARDAQNEYNKWNQSPCTYNPPGPYAGTYNTSTCGTLAGLVGLAPPTLQDFENYGAYLANSDYSTNSGLSLASQQAARGYALLYAAAVSAATAGVLTGLGVSGLGITINTFLPGVASTPGRK
jgi:hypothetical protein